MKTKDKLKKYRVVHEFHSKITNEVEAENEEDAIAKSREEISGNLISINDAETYDERAREINPHFSRP